MYFRFFCSICFFFSSCYFASSQIANCNFLCNTDFENVIVTPPGAWTLVYEGTIPCWQTTATDNRIEVWGTGFNGVTAYSGAQFIELNANMVSTIYQDFTPVAGSTAIISFAHRGRAGTDVMSVEIGPVGGPYVQLGTFSTGNTAWSYHSINFTFPTAIPNPYTLRFNSVSAAGGNAAVGNFLDAISISLPTPAITTAVTPTTCNDSSAGAIQLNISGGTPPYSYQWSNGITNSSSLSGLTSGTYAVIVSDAYGCSSSVSVVIPDLPVLYATAAVNQPSCFGSSDGYVNVSVTTGTPPYSIIWNGRADTTFQINGLPAGSYDFQVHDNNGCVFPGSATLIEPAQLQLQLSAQPSGVCSGDSALLSASGSGFQYEWTGGPTSADWWVLPASTSSYTVMGTDNYGCTGIGWITVNVHPAPSATLLPDTICTGSDFTPVPQITTAGIPAAVFMWNFGDGYYTNDASPVHNYALPGTYNLRLQIYDIHGCGASCSTAIVSLPLPSASFSLNTVEGCMPLLLSFNNESNSITDSIVSISWQPPAFGNSSSGTIALENPGSYTVGLTVTTSSGCSDDTLLDNAIVVHPKPWAGFYTTNPIVSEFNAAVEFQNTSIGSTSTEWNFGDGSFSFEFEPLHVFEYPGSYQTQQIVTNDHGCRDTVYGTIEVRPERSIWVPNCFSPNGDERNEEFRPISRNMKFLSLEIYNRWGAMIFRDDSVYPVWNGYASGSPAPIGVYDYMVQYEDPDKGPQKITGKVTLIR